MLRVRWEYAPPNSVGGCPRNAPPTQDTIRTACRVFDVHVQEILVAAGYMTPDESGLDDKPISLSSLSTQDLLDELARRSASHSLASQ